MKVRSLASDLRELGDSVRADEIEGRIKAAQQESARGFRDRQEIYEEGDLLRLGRHRFSVNSQPFDLTLVPRGEDMALHLTGTDFYETIDDAAFAETRSYWQQTTLSESDELYRAEFLAGSILEAAEHGSNGLSLDALRGAVESETVLELVRRVAAERYDEGYERGVHDADAAKILGRLVALHSTAGLLRYPGTCRAHALLYWALGLDRDAREELRKRARSLLKLREHLGATTEIGELAKEVSGGVEDFLTDHGMVPDPGARG